MELKLKREEIVKYFLSKGKLISGDFLNYLEDESNLEFIHTRINEGNVDLDVLTQELISISREPEPPPSSFESEHNENISGNDSSTIIRFNYIDEPQKKIVGDFISYFRKRFDSLESILRGRPELQNVMSINRISNKTDRENIALIGMVREKQTTKNGNLMITVEDKTGAIKVIVNKSKLDLFETAKDIVPDEVIGMSGVNGNKIVFADNLIFPDVPLTKEFKKAPEEAYAVFVSDFHIGSRLFREDKILKFLKWISGEIGTEDQKRIAGKVTHLFVVGDLVDSVGVYPGQENELEIKDFYEQYKKCAQLLSMVPPRIKIIICPGNHDAMRIAEPQPPLYQDFAEDLYKLPNTVLVSNPSFVTIGKTENFRGFDVLLYHGFSFDYYYTNVESIRKHGNDRSDLIMQFLMKKRHLAPTYGSTRIMPTADRDNLVISSVPDIFVTGHVHRCSTPSNKSLNYRNISLISCSCFQDTTPFQEKVGHKPDPGRVPVINLQTREIKILKF